MIVRYEVVKLKKTIKAEVSHILTEESAKED